MNSEELDRFETLLSARVAELENKAHRRDRIVVETSPDQLDEIQLAAMPWALLCIRCQETADRNLKDPREQYRGRLLAAQGA
jgi:hypothetical protein